MAHELTIEQLKEKYQEVANEGRGWMHIVQKEQEYTLNLIATVKMNACTQIKRAIKERIGEITVKNETVSK